MSKMIKFSPFFLFSGIKNFFLIKDKKIFINYSLSTVK